LTVDTLKLDLLGDRKRTHYCGDLRKEHTGQKVFLAGWVDRRRDLGNLIFLDLRDHSGWTQVVCNPAIDAESHDRAEDVRPEYVVGVEGEVVLRDPGTVNVSIPTGEVEVVARKLLVFNEAKTPPFPLDEDAKTAEETRLRFRFLDLRRGRMQRNLRLRNEANKVVRAHLDGHGFIDIETPFMTRSTPEGARDYLVPSRVHHGKFYALPQSPQLFKQILMISGYNRYYQIVRCFRDEDLRADRQPEFTQVDIEMAFPSRHELFGIIEELIVKMFALVDVKPSLPFARMPYDEAMEKFGSDKPHTGFGLAWKRHSLAAEDAEKIRLANPCKLLCVPGEGGMSRSQLDRLTDLAKTNGADWFSYIKLTEGAVQSPLSKTLGEAAVKTLAETASAKAGDLVLILGAKAGSTTRGWQYRVDGASGEIRLDLARRLELIRPGTWNFLWVVDFPMFDYDEASGRYVAMHHPFTSPREADLAALESDPGSAKALAYDLVLNGSEIGGGSIRIHRQDVQKRVFTILGLTEEKARERFGFFLDALEYGTPPHGGIALGYDRIIALMAGESNIREVIAFPKTASAIDLMCEAPAGVDPDQLDELGIAIKKHVL
jgi:aspartyl-tRNA synthetase